MGVAPDAGPAHPSKVQLLIGLGSTVTPRQVVSRLARRARYRALYPRLGQRLYEVPPIAEVPSALTTRQLDEQSAAQASSAEALLAEANAFSARMFSYLNLSPVHLGVGEWRTAPNGDPLWSYYLHYGEWGTTLAHAWIVSGDPAYRDALINLINEWITFNPVGSEPGWEPYPIARRLVAWSRTCVSLRRDPVWQGFWRRRLEPSMRAQARLLAANLEHDVPNNHLVSDFRALAWVGLSFPHWPEASRWRDFGLDGLWGEMARQVLADGAHDERSVSYHTIVLQDLLETWCLARLAEVPTPDSVESTLRSMFTFLVGMRSPGGTWPMVNDSVPGYPSDPSDIIRAGATLFDDTEWAAAAADGSPAYAAWLGAEPTAAPVGAHEPRGIAFREAGYATVAGPEGDWLVFDAGPIASPRVPGHGHADALSFELHSGSTPLVVDPGVFTYAAGVWRDQFRSTLAHNTVTVDGQDQCIFWGPFRVSFPVQAELTDWSARHAEGVHTGYTRLPDSVVHSRRVSWLAPHTWELHDRLDGCGSHSYELTLQLSAGAELDVSGTGGRARWPGRTSLDIECLSPPRGAAAARETGFVSDSWNKKEQCPRYVLRWTSSRQSEVRILLRTSR